MIVDLFQRLLYWYSRYSVLTYHILQHRVAWRLMLLPYFVDSLCFCVIWLIIYVLLYWKIRFLLLMNLFEYNCTEFIVAILLLFLLFSAASEFILHIRSQVILKTQRKNVVKLAEILSGLLKHRKNRKI